MREDFLHYLWKFRKFAGSGLHTANGEPITIIHSGQYLQLSGPDFFNAQLQIGNQKWAGNVEIHLKSSDWYAHHHETDTAYENVILHVVWEHDAEVYRKDNSEIPVLELRHFTPKETLENYRSLLAAKSWIFCERQLSEMDPFLFRNWLERLFLERLERKSEPIATLLQQTGHDWEAVLFCLLAKNFGLNTNGEAFLKIATVIPFSIIRKESAEVENLEALFFGFAGLLADEKQDQYFFELKSRFDYLCHKHQLDATQCCKVEFFKHRPDNFPTIRLGQLAALYHFEKQLFSKIMAADSATGMYAIFAVSISDYWKTHYQFDSESRPKPKQLSRAFIDLVILNTIVPLQFVYAKANGREISESLLGLLNAIKPESNAIIDKFASFGVKPDNAFETQALLQLKKEYCDNRKCLDCAIGIALLQS